MDRRVSSRSLSDRLSDGGTHLLSRRMLLVAAAASVLRSQEAEISNFDFSLLDEGTTPPELFFIREHFPPPGVSSADWKLSIRGTVSAPAGISFDELVALPRKLLPVTIECAENPPAGGLISHAEWSGVPLSALLEKVRPGTDARFVRLSGADGFSRSIPLAKAIHADTLLAYQMNGEKLSVKHGFPVRAVVPGWYGMDSIKWLRGIEVLTAEPPEQGYQRQVRSLLTGTRPGGPITVMNVKSAFSRPLDGAILIGRHFTVRGAAWAGENRVRQVEIRTDRSSLWQPAKLLSQPRPYEWVHWVYEWKIQNAGEYELSVRAADDQGRQQPLAPGSERVDAYESNSSQIIKVTVT